MNGHVGESLNDLVVTKGPYGLRKDSHTGDTADYSFSDGTLNRHYATMNGHQLKGNFSTDTFMDTRGMSISNSNRVDTALLSSMTIEGFSDYIARERLSSMPHRGSVWDRVLRWAEFYALQIAAYADTIGPFVPESRNAAMQIFTLLQSLLELGEENATALNTTFGVFYKIGLSLSFLSSQEAKLGLDVHVREDAGRAFHDIHTLVFDVASYYQRSVQNLSNGSALALDFITLFRVPLDSFYTRRTLLVFTAVGATAVLISLLASSTISGDMLLAAMLRQVYRRSASG